ncbi:glutathione S-transferase family protein [Phenylobacterium sp.]|uniref:glutathione S-transferase family protein n=1 Tax=Phenylobacterium sp. TaxID=1871053 RepID=UPI0030F3D21D
MKLYDSMGPNPHVVRMFIAEKGMTIPTQKVDLMGGENRKPPYNEAINTAGQIPALELDNGHKVCEILPICEYLEEVQPAPPLIGANAEERAETRMWTRRIDLNICEPLANGFRAAEGRPLFESRMKLVGAEGASELKAIAKDRMIWLDSQMKGDFVCGGRFTLADILLYGFLTFGATVGQPVPDDAKWIKGWMERVKARPSSAA